MATPVIISLLVGLVAGGAFMAMWAANRIEEEGVRQFDRGFERGRWLTDISVAKALEDQDRTRRVGLLVAGARPAGGLPATRPPAQEPARRCSSSPRRVRSPSTSDRRSAALEARCPPTRSPSPSWWCWPASPPP
jgi:hypothetical protein